MPDVVRKPARIAVVGGGAGGLELAIRLARLTRPGGRARVTLVDRRPSHIWKPRLHEIAAGLLVAAEEEAAYAVQARRHGFDFLLGEVQRLDPQARRIDLAATPFPADDPVERAGDGPLLPPRTVAYDTAVLALGSTVNDFGVPGVSEHCHTLDSAAGAERLHRALLARAARVREGVRPSLRVVVVGAGTTGVELAAELRTAAGRLPELRSLLRPDQLEVTVVERAKRALPTSPRAVSDYARRMLTEHGVVLRLDAPVSRVDADGVEVKGGGRVEADVIVWASGVKAQRLARPVEGAGAGKDGRLTVDTRLRVLASDGGVMDGLFALGDCAAAPLGEGVTPATAQAAHQQAALLARSLARRTRGRELLDFRYRDRGTLVSLGAGGAVGDLPEPSGGALRISGVGAKLAYVGLYEQHLAELHGVWRTAALAVGGALRRSAQPSVKLWW